MATPYSPYGPSTGPGNQALLVPLPARFSPSPGYAWAANYQQNTAPNPGPQAPATDNGILLEPSWNSFIELEDNSGWLVIE
jgi:hypothetical protein